MPNDNARSVSAAWGVCGFLSILASAVRRLGPIALQPFVRMDLSLLQWSCYAASVIGFAYVEGYGAFQKKFSPMVVRRAMTLTRAGAGVVKRVFAPFYSMGLFHASRKRKIVSWSVSLTVFMLVGLVKRLPYPWRSIVDAGVCSGLCWGGASIVIFYARALGGTPPHRRPRAAMREWEERQRCQRRCRRKTPAEPNVRRLLRGGAYGGGCASLRSARRTFSSARTPAPAAAPHTPLTGLSIACAVERY